MWMSGSAIQWILHCGRVVSQVSRHGRVPGDSVDPGGILNVPRCRCSISVKRSTSMAEEWILFSRTTRMRSRNRAVRREKSLHAIGSIMGLCKSTKRRCRSHWETSSRFERFLRSQHGPRRSQAKSFDIFCCRRTTIALWIFQTRP